MRSWAEIVRYIASAVPDVATSALSRAANLADVSGPNAEHVAWAASGTTSSIEEVATQTAEREPKVRWPTPDVTLHGAHRRRARRRCTGPGEYGDRYHPVPSVPWRLLRSNQKGPLAGHVRKGRVYKPPLVAAGLGWGTGRVTTYPDLLWPILVMAGQAPRRSPGSASWQKAVQGDLKDAEHARRGWAQRAATSLDGSLTLYKENRGVRAAGRPSTGSSRMRCRAGLSLPVPTGCLVGGGCTRAWPGRP